MLPLFVIFMAFVLQLQYVGLGSDEDKKPLILKSEDNSSANNQRHYNHIFSQNRSDSDRLSKLFNFWTIDFVG